jgi:hypothetical protein
MSFKFQVTVYHEKKHMETFVVGGKSKHSAVTNVLTNKYRGKFDTIEAHLLDDNTKKRVENVVLDKFNPNGKFPEITIRQVDVNGTLNINLFRNGEHIGVAELNKTERTQLKASLNDILEFIDGEEELF